MCGIFFSLSNRAPQQPSQQLLTSLRRRGPDSLAQYEAVVSDPASGNTLYAYFLSTVLSLRGNDIVSQPLTDPSTGSVFCWNGEAWKIGPDPVPGNDSERVFKLLLKASASHCSSKGPSEGVHKDAVLQAISSISGPYALVYYDALNCRVIYGRDCLGRRSLLRKTNSKNELILSSISDASSPNDWVEVEADGLYIVAFSRENAGSALEDPSFTFSHVPYQHGPISGESLNALVLPYPEINKTSPSGDEKALTTNSETVKTLEQCLRQSLTVRVKDIHEARASPSEADRHTHVAVLFSGGLDCSVVARLAHDLLPPEEHIDLLNVAFQNPRVQQQAEKESHKTISPYDLCPDRITGKASYAELQRVCPERTWKFVEINVPYNEALSHRQTVIDLMYPHKTEMDLSIAYALYFASRGAGIILGPEPMQYTTPARVLLSGLGADELFGGYQRHAVAFSRHGFPGLNNELELDINRLGKRNLGRDDRAISYWSREVRFPYLDESLLHWALGTPVWEKCGFGQENINAEVEVPEIEPGKKVLRLLAWRLGLHGVAVEKKRAIQFGARTAKMERGRSKGTEILY